MAYWLVGDATYISVLLDIESLPAAVAAQAAAVVKDLDPQFFLRFSKATARPNLSGVSFCAASAYCRSLGDYSILIFWLRALGQNGDVRVRSRAAKLLCELRPNKGLIERQMLSGDARVRAGAIEAVWHAKNDESRAIFQAALSDCHHRVVSNVLVGLYRMGQTETLNDMIDLCAHKDHLFPGCHGLGHGFREGSARYPHAPGDEPRSIPCRAQARLEQPGGD